MGKFEDKMMNLSRKIDVPSNIVRNVSKIEIIADDTIFIENHRGILLLEDTDVHVNCGDIIVKIHGLNLDIGSISSSDLTIFGSVLNIDFVR